MKNFLICVAIFFLLCLAGNSQQTKPSPAVRADQPVLTADLHPAAPPASVVRPSVTAVLPVGTPIRVTLDQTLDTHRTKAGDAFSAKVSEPIMLNGMVMVPAGSSLQGHVLRVSEPRRIKGRPVIQLKTESLQLPDGQSYAINASVVDTNRVNGTHVDDEGRIIGGTRTKRDNIELGAGTGAGSIVGVIAAGARGTLIGAGAGAGVATAYWLTKRNTARLPQGTEIILELGRPLPITAQR
jgi:hypothetical protein